MLHDSIRQQPSATSIIKKEERPLLPSDNKTLAFSVGESHVEIFYHQQGLLMLHLVVMIMLVPSLVAWIQVGACDLLGYFHLVDFVCTVLLEFCQLQSCVLVCSRFFVLIYGVFGICRD